MAAYFIVSIEIDDPARRGPYDEYIERVKPIVESFGGRYITRSEKVTPFAGGWRPSRVIVIEFAGREALEACFSSPQYSAVAPLRENTVRTSAIIVED